MSADARSTKRAIDRIRGDDRSPMENLPYWARATNPIVRRHLGLYWRTLPPEFEPIFYICGFWLGALLLGIFLPFVTDLATTAIVVSVLVIPVGMIFYIRALFSIAAHSASAMSEEIRNNTMQLLMSTPMSLEQIFLGKAASAIWRKMDDLMLIAQGAALFGPPLIIMHYAGFFPLRESGGLTYGLIIAMTVVSVLRLVLEPIMFGMVGVLIGAFIPFRSIAMSSSVAFVAFYFLLMIMLQQLNLRSLTAALEGAGGLDIALALGMTVFIELLLPLLIPLGLIRLVIGTLTRQLRAN